MGVNYKVSGVWKAITAMAFKFSSIWKIINSGWVNIGGVWKQFYNTVSIPVNMIAFSTSTSVGNWSRCNGSDVSLNLIGKYPKVHASQGGAGGAVSHSHSVISASTSSPSARYFGPGSYSESYVHEHTINHTHTANENNEPEYLKVLPVTEGDQILTSMFLFYEGSSPPSGWSTHSAAYNKMFKGDATPQTSPTGGNASHSHSHSGNSGNTTPGGTIAVGNTGAHYKATQKGSHSHSISHTHTNGQNYPLWVGLLPIVPDIDTSDIPSGVIAFFKDSSIPSGWSAYSAATGKWIQGKSAGSGSGGANSHNHTDSLNTQFYADSEVANASGSTGRTVGTASGHRHPMTHTHNTVNNIPPYQELMLLKKD